MKKLLSLPVKMSLSAAEKQVYQNVLKYVPPLSLNLMAVKVEYWPDDFLSWCGELIRLCREDLNMDYLEASQLPTLSKLESALETGFTISQFKMARIAPWPIFVGFIQQQNKLHALDERLRLLNYIEGIRHTPLAELSLEDRLAFAGKHTSAHAYTLYDFDVEWFASTKGAKVFHLLLEQSPEKFDAALAHIPLTGDVGYEHYQEFVREFEQIFYTADAEKGSNKPPLMAATRLLAMRRPDQFIALNNNKSEVICQGLSIPKLKNNDFASYWHDVIYTLRTFAWWHQTEPEVAVDSTDFDSYVNNDSTLHNAQAFEHTLWKNRAILIDLFLFAAPELAENSHFIRARDKAQNRVSARANRIPKSRISAKRIKETPEEAIDKALASDDLPDYMQSKRDSLVNQVKNGKGVDEAIQLMRAIFG